MGSCGCGCGWMFYALVATHHHLKTFIFAAHFNIHRIGRISLSLFISFLNCVIIFSLISFHFPFYISRFSFLFVAVTGTCLFTYGLKLGELCSRDADCESGLVCDVSATSGASVCRAPMAVAKQYAEDCLSSSDCDISRYVTTIEDTFFCTKI